MMKVIADAIHAVHARAWSSCALAALLAVGPAACGDDRGRQPADGESVDLGGELGEACGAEVAYFRQEVYGSILSVQCVGCHNAQGPAAGSRMLLTLGDDDESVKNNLRAVATVAAVDAGDQPLLLAMPSDTNPDRKHPGGALLSPQGEDYGRLAALADALRTPGCQMPTAATDSCGQASVGPRALRRLTPAQYDRTVRDLTGLSGAWGESFPADVRSEGFDNGSDALVVSPLLADKLQAAAEDIAQRVDLAALLDCDVAALDRACAERLVRSFGKRAFRRPLADEDVARYATLLDVAGDLEAGCRLVVTAMLQSPHFLYRFEIGGAATADETHLLTDHEIATELSYLITGSMPDAELMAAADGGLLHTPEQITAHAQRLLMGDASREVMRDFGFQWLGLDRLATVPKDAETFPELTPAIRAEMAAEAAALFERVAFDEEQGLSELLTTPLSTRSEALAAFYGQPAPAPGKETPLPERTGVLNLGGVMLTHARSNDSSPIHRGRLVRERLLCQVPPPPPPGINAEPPALDPTQTARQRYAAHSAQQPCQSCHRLMDPIGFSFEHFDGIGRYRQDDHGNPIDVSGEVVSTAHTDGIFEGTAELSALLADSPDVRDCFASQWFRYATGLPQTGASACASIGFSQAYDGGGASLRGLYLTLAEATHLRMRVEAEDAGGTEPTGGPGGSGDGAMDSAGAGGAVAAGDGDGDGDGAGQQPPGQQVELVQNDRWDTGYCHTYEVTNTGGAPLTWAVMLAITGQINHAWEAAYDGVTGEVTFTGLTHNATLAAAASTRFGLCVDL